MIRFWAGSGRLDYTGCDCDDPVGPCLSVVRTVSMAACVIATEYYAAGDDHLVVIISIAGLRYLVFRQVSLTPNLADFDLHNDALDRLLRISGKRRHGLSPACTVAGFLLCVCRGRVCFA